MKIELQEPFKSLWLKGYIVTNKELRNHVCLFNSSTDRTTISLARYKMCCKLGYILEDYYEVDHIDNDKTNDNIENLQVLTKEQNRAKETERYNRYEKVFHDQICPACNKEFKVSSKIYNGRIKLNKDHRFFCSSKCSCVHTAMKPLCKTLISKINDPSNEYLTNYRLAKILGITAPTVKKYRL